MKQCVAAFITGCIFAVGLTISGMTNPAKVLAFLNVTNNWDPSLMFVMVGAIGVYAIAFHFITKKEKPILESIFSIPENSSIDRNLILGATIFGIGWGTAGFCPGPAIVNLGLLEQSVVIFCLSMGAGMFFHHLFHQKTEV